MLRKIKRQIEDIEEGKGLANFLDVKEVNEWKQQKSEYIKGKEIYYV